MTHLQCSLLVARPLLSFFYFVNYPGQSTGKQTVCMFHSSIILSVMCMALFLLFDLNYICDIIKRKKWLSSISFLSKCNLSTFQRSKTFTLGSRLNINSYFFWLNKWNQPCSHDICFFFILWESESKETKYSENEVEVKLKIRLKLGRLKYLNISLIWMKCKERSWSYGLKI